jgi:hypothetical protein
MGATVSYGATVIYGGAWFPDFVWCRFIAFQGLETFCNEPLSMVKC